MTAKEAYRKEVESHLEDDDSRRVWQGIHHLGNYFGNLPVAVTADASLAEELNLFFTCFESPRPPTSLVFQ